MVGEPKSVYDLRRIEAQVRAICGRCKEFQVWELPALIAKVTANGGNANWDTAKYAVKCPMRCASPMIRLVPIPFGKERAGGGGTTTWRSIFRCKSYGKPTTLHEGHSRHNRGALGLHVLRL